MRKSKQFLSMPVISLQEGQQIGTIKGLVVDPSLKQVVALVIEQKGWFKEQKYIPFSKVKSVGENAVTIDRTTSAERGNSLPNIMKLIKDNVEIIGCRIITEGGTLLGYAEEYYIDLIFGQLIGFEFADKFLSSVMNGKAFLDANYIQTIGKDVIICSDEALDNVIKIEKGIQETVKSIKDSTSHLWDNTVQKTRNIGNSLNKSLGKIKIPKGPKQKENRPGSGKPADTPPTPEE